MPRPGDIPMQSDAGDDPELPGERLMVELMALAVFCSASHREERIPLMDLIKGDLGCDARGWVELLRERGWSVNADGNGVRFEVVRG